MKGIRIALINIVENIKELENFKTEYGNEPRLYIWVPNEKSHLN